MKTDFPEDDVEFKNYWSSYAGKLSGLKVAIEEIEKRSCEAFIKRQDEIAGVLRNLAADFKNKQSEYEDIVRSCIAENRRRHTQ